MSPLERYREAVESEHETRDLAYIDLPRPLCGVLVKPFCPQHYILLEHGGNRFICGGVVRPEDVAMFLWVVSVDYAASPSKRDAFVAGIRDVVGFVSAKDQIRGYIDQAFLDSPGGGDGNGRSYMSWVASLVDAMGSEYGWSYRETVSVPFGVLFQQIKAIQKRHNPKRPMINPSDRLLSEIMAERNREAAGRACN